MKSAKNTYVQARLRLGRLSIRVRLIPSSAKAESASLRTPGRSLTENTTLVLSLPVRTAQHDKARGVRAGVLDVARKHRQTVGACRQYASDRGHPRLDCRAAGRLRRGIDLIQAGSREFAPEPARRLGQGHGMRAYQAHPLHRLFCGDQILGDRQVYLPADPQWTVHQLVQGVGHGTLHGVLDGHDAMFDLPAFDPGEDLGDRRLRLELDAGAKRTQGGLVRERRLRPEVSDLEAGLERDGG